MELSMKVDVMVVNKSTNELPKYQTSGSSGVDLRANLEKPVILNPMDRALIPTGLYVDIPIGFEGQIRPRSGLAIKYGISLINCIGTIDSDYRGEIMIPLINLGKEPVTIEHGERVAQFVLQCVEKIRWQETVELIDTQRGSGGFGHTGK